MLVLYALSCREKMEDLLTFYQKMKEEHARHMRLVSCETKRTLPISVWMKGIMKEVTICKEGIKTKKTEWRLLKHIMA